MMSLLPGVHGSGLSDAPGTAAMGAVVALVDPAKAEVCMDYVVRRGGVGWGGGGGGKRAVKRARPMKADAPPQQQAHGPYFFFFVSWLFSSFAYRTAARRLADTMLAL